MEDNYNLSNVINKLATRTNLPEASIRNMISFQPDSQVAKYLNASEADLLNFLEGNSSPQIAEIFNLTIAELDNLLDKFQTNFGIGMIIGKMLS